MYDDLEELIHLCVHAVPHCTLALRLLVQRARKHPDGCSRETTPLCRCEGDQSCCLVRLGRAAAANRSPCPRQACRGSHFLSTLPTTKAGRHAQARPRCYSEESGSIWLYKHQRLMNILILIYKVFSIWHLAVECSAAFCSNIGLPFRSCSPPMPAHFRKSDCISRHLIFTTYKILHH